ncbi:MAG TPA: hypothetical protein VGF25_06065 [Thermoleophilaceae bacterium]|jgi:hypothetical protein
MTTTTQSVRDQAFLPLHSDIPQGVTMRQWRRRRRRHRAGAARLLRRPRPTRL